MVLSQTASRSGPQTASVWDLSKLRLPLSVRLRSANVARQVGSWTVSCWRPASAVNLTASVRGTGARPDSDFDPSGAGGLCGSPTADRGAEDVRLCSLSDSPRAVAASPTPSAILLWSDYSY